jgi:hypothetical protein
VRVDPGGVTIGFHVAWFCSRPPPLLPAGRPGAAVLVGELGVGRPVVVQADEGAEAEVAHAGKDGRRARDVGLLVRAAGVKAIHIFRNPKLDVNP